MYNYVVFGSNWDLYKFSYRDIIRAENAIYIPTPYFFRSPLQKFFYKVHWSPKINRYLDLPFKNFWNSGYFNHDFQDQKPICFIFFSNWCQYEKNGLLKFLRLKFPDAKLVCFFQDLIDLKKDINIQHIKEVYDLVLSFDLHESRKYDLEYHQLVFSQYPIKKSPNISECDVYFLGKAKNRLGSILKTFNFLKSKGLNCSFFWWMLH